MNKATLISEMQKFHLGSKVFYSDGEEGILVHTNFDPSTRRLTFIGVKQGRLFGKTINLPFNTVIKASGDGVTLNVKRGEIPASSNTETGGALLESKTMVVQTDSTNKGPLILVAVQPETGELVYLVAHNLRPAQDTLIRAEYVTSLETDQIKVMTPDTIFKTLPPYRPDSALQQDVEAVIFDLTPLHVDMKGITARVLDGVLYLDGNISSALRGDIVQDQVLGVPGLLEIKNNLVGDDRLAADIAMALGQDPRTRDLPIGVYPRLGVVRLSGAVHNGQQKAAAGEIAQNFPGVRSVINDLIIDPKANLLNVMSSAEGGEAKDKVPGKYIRHTK
jgi:osmotically-inducible protein OsmY